MTVDVDEIMEPTVEEQCFEIGGRKRSTLPERDSGTITVEKLLVKNRLTSAERACVFRGRKHIVGESGSERNCDATTLVCSRLTLQSMLSQTSAPALQRTVP